MKTLAIVLILSMGVMAGVASATCYIGSRCNAREMAIQDRIESLNAKRMRGEHVSGGEYSDLEGQAVRAYTDRILDRVLDRAYGVQTR